MIKSNNEMGTLHSHANYLSLLTLVASTGQIQNVSKSLPVIQEKCVSNLSNVLTTSRQTLSIKVYVVYTALVSNLGFLRPNIVIMLIQSKGISSKSMLSLLHSIPLLQPIFTKSVIVSFIVVNLFPKHLSGLELNQAIRIPFF